MSSSRGLLTFKEVSRLIGKDRHTLYRQSWKGNIRTVRRGGRVFIPASEVDKIRRKGGVKNGDKDRT